MTAQTQAINRRSVRLATAVIRRLDRDGYPEVYGKDDASMEWQIRVLEMLQRWRPDLQTPSGYSALKAIAKRARSEDRYGDGARCAGVALKGEVAIHKAEGR